MTNEMKLITALCDALGFEVEKVCINQDEINEYAKNINELVPRDATLVYPDPKPARYELVPAYEYKLTKSVEKELTLDEKAVEDYVLRNEAMLTKRVESKIPKSFIDDNLKKAEESKMFGMPLKDLTKEELMCCVVFSWEESSKTRDAAKGQNKLDLARFCWSGKA